MAKLLLVEDEIDLAKQLEDWFKREQHTIDVVHSGQDALNHLKISKYDLVILDWMLPQLSGLEVLQHMRSRNNRTPVIMLTAKDSEDDKEKGLDSGADDYVTKPFSLRELSARTRAALRRSSQAAKTILSAGDIELDPISRTVSKSNLELHLEPKEFNLLEFFMRHPQQVFSADALIDRVWPSDTLVSTDAIRTYIKILRKKLDNERVIQNVRGVGYKFEPDVK
ncbi:MAG: response regulator transcription factor [Candidatus Melainabacteria bacterium]|nr:response regulator transcription factor [Candidatus Melainabacteria bacterium]